MFKNIYVPSIFNTSFFDTHIHMYIQIMINCGIYGVHDKYTFTQVQFFYNLDCTVISINVYFISRCSLSCSKNIH